MEFKRYNRPKLPRNHYGYTGESGNISLSSDSLSIATSLSAETGKFLVKLKEIADFDVTGNLVLKTNIITRPEIGDDDGMDDDASLS